ncbi:MAG: hypothetical protein J6D28_05710 [Bacilli bacterium]|nr:hypothetical protein [Bacilli bacterium]
MNIIILIAVIILFVFLFKRTFSSFVYAVAVTDIFFRIVTFLKIQLTSGSLKLFLDKYIPSNIPEVIREYTKNEFSLVLIWGYVILMIVFEFYAIRTFMHKK